MHRRLLLALNLPKPSVFVIDTRNVSTGSTASNQFKIPMISPFFNPITIDWGDGSDNYIGTYNQAELTHTYAVEGIYEIKVYSTAWNFYFNNTGDRLKLLEIKMWSNLRISGSEFYGCSNLILTNVADVPNLLLPNSNLVITFRGTTNLTTINYLELWDVSPILNMDGAFYTSGFNQSLGAWNFNKNVVTTNIFFGKTPANYSASNYDDFLNKLASCVIGTGRTQTTKQIGAGTIKRTAAGTSSRAALISDGWTINDGGI